VFAIVHTVTQSAPLACLAAAAWGTCPVNEGALGWLAASGNVMVATATLAVLHSAVRAVWRGTHVGVGRAAVWAALLLAAAQSFGTGLGVAIAAPLVLAWLAWDRMTWAARAVLLGVPLFTAGMYGADYSQFTGRLTSSTLAKADMLVHLHAIGLTTLIRGLGYEPGPADFLAAPTFENVPSTYPRSMYVIAALATCLWAFVALRSSCGRMRRLLVTLAVLALSNYGAIAVGRGYWIEAFHQSVVRWAGQARYHYSAAAVLAIGLAVVAATVVGKRLAAWGRPALVAWLGMSAFLYARTHWTIRHYDAERLHAGRILARIDATIRAAPAGEPVVTYNEPFLEGPYIDGAAALYVMNHSRDSREVYFVDRRAPIIYQEFPGSPLARVMVPPPSMGLACGPRLSLQSDGQ
jgi:hypothetical protein